MQRRSHWQWAGLLLAVLWLAGCATQARYYSSAVDYLYPDKGQPAEQVAIPVMELPLKVGVAFVPDSTSRRQQSFWSTLFPGRASSHPDIVVLSEQQKIELMQRSAEHFDSLDEISKIEIIPSAYLTQGGSFANLDQIRTMYGIDTIALISYDQVQFTDEGASSFFYWTLVGAYLVPGEKNSTRTMIDTVVYDIKSRKMLFRAPGVSQVKGKATPVNLTEELRRDSAQGFQTAADDMVKNLDLQLELFREKVRQAPEEYQVVKRRGYTGGASIGGFFAGAFLLLGGSTWLRRRRR